MQTGQLYRLVRDRFREEGLATPELDARLLVGAALGLSSSDLILRDLDQVSDEAAAVAMEHAARRLDGMPVGRILGEREFYGRTFRMNAATLEPRPDTEILVDAVLAETAAGDDILMCDIGTGTGAIAVTLLAELPGARAIATDLSFDALNCASANAQVHGVANRLLTVQADYLSALGPEFDWVISNPPYIRTAVLAELGREVVQHDPALALDGGESGLEAYVRIVADAVRVLRAGGKIALEIGFDQAADLINILEKQGFAKVSVRRDLAGSDRVVTALKP